MWNMIHPLTVLKPSGLAASLKSSSSDSESKRRDVDDNTTRLGWEKLADDYTLEPRDDEHGAMRSVNPQRRCGDHHSANSLADVAVAFLRQSAGKLAMAAVAIEEAYGQTPGVLLYEVERCRREIYCSDLDGVVVDGADSKAEAVAQVRGFMAGLQAAGVNA